MDFQEAFGADPRPILLVDVSRTVRAFNAAARRNIGAVELGADLIGFSADEPAVIDAYLQICSASRGPLAGALRLVNPAGLVVPWHVDGGVLRPAEGSDGAMLILRLRNRMDAHAGFVALVDEIGRLSAELEHRRRLERELQTALSAKEVLLSELHHRVKNNLQIVMALLRISGKGDPAFLQTIERIRAMGQVHELLYQSETLSVVDCSALLDGLTASIAAIQGRPEIKLRVECDRTQLQPQVATSLALLVNELVWNAYKHAFPGGHGGNILVRFNVEDRIALLAVIDDGARIKDVVAGTGLTVARSLAATLGGPLEMTSEPVKAFSVGFVLR